MPTIDLTRYIVASSGTWTDPAQDKNLFSFTLSDTMSPGRLMLRWSDDFVALTGPLRVRVTVQAENMTVPLGYLGNMVSDQGMVYRLKQEAGTFTKVKAGRPQASTIYSYVLDVPAGEAWPFSLSEQYAKLRLANARYEQLGNNLGFRVIIEPAFAVPECRPIDVTSCDLPCDFAVADQPNSGRFFPSACEPCEGSVIGLPPSETASLTVSPAPGGCVRTRFFNGMMITREDLETEQRYARLKTRLHNRVLSGHGGVGWGFGVGMQGSQICVMPGYGVDCCGNDLVLTTTYVVEVAALLADPALAAARYTQPSYNPAALYLKSPADVFQRGGRRMSLLLEYVECPADPRPVHADGCMSDAARCEMSRIRESVRLRLVPPCDDACESAPIQHFLNQVAELRKQYPVEQVTQPAAALEAPFQLRIDLINASGQSQSQTVRPIDGNSDLKLSPDEINSARVTVLMDSLWTFADGTLTLQALDNQGNTVKNVADPPDPQELSFGERPIAVFTLPAEGVLPSTLMYAMEWQAKHFFAGSDDVAIGGKLALIIRLGDRSVREGQLISSVAWQQDTRGPAPCSEPCSTGSYGGGNNPCAQGSYTSFNPDDCMRFSPWLHADPSNPSKSGDLKTLMLAALGGWLAETLVRERVGTQTEVKSPRREIAQAIYRVAWMMLFGVSQKADPAKLGNALDQLLRTWCNDALWKGPECCCDPHGVVIGCAVVEGGAIQSIDAFGGRRYLMHYPILEHWGKEFGIAPLDLTITRFFSRLCCVAGLPALQVDKPNVPAGFTTLGAGYVAVGEPAEVEKALGERVVVIERRNVGLPEMIANAVTLLSNQGTRQGKQTDFHALSLKNFIADNTLVLYVPA
jgi:hypothetical protein